MIQNGANNHQKTIPKSIANLIRKKALPKVSGSVLAAAPGGVQFNKTPPEETYINRKKTKRRCPTCKKSKEGTNNLQKYQTDDQRKVIYEGKLPKGNLQKVIYEGKLQKSDLQKVIYEGKLQKR